MQVEKMGRNWPRSGIQWEDHVIALYVVEKFISEVAPPIRRIREGGKARDAATARFRVWWPTNSFARRLSDEKVEPPYTVKSERRVACLTCFRGSEYFAERGPRRRRHIRTTGRRISAIPNVRFYGCQCNRIHRCQCDISSFYCGQRIQFDGTLRIRERCFDTSSFGRKSNAFIEKYPRIPPIKSGHSIAGQRIRAQSSEAKTQRGEYQWRFSD